MGILNENIALGQRRIVADRLASSSANTTTTSGAASGYSGCLMLCIHLRKPVSTMASFPKTNMETPMSMMSEFKEFALKGNVMDLAVGVIIGGAFGKIVDSMVGDLIMPLVGAVVGNLDFSSMYMVLGNIPAGAGASLVEMKKAGVPVLAYGNFITIAVNFIILAFIIFMMVKQMNRLKREVPPAPAAPAVTPEDILLLRQIRDSLSK
jgi:large conductance mechanosensitive channel